MYLQKDSPVPLYYQLAEVLREKIRLGELKPGAIVTEEGMAHLFKRHVVSVKRAVERGELPPPCHLFGSKVWTAGILIRHIERRLEQAAREAEKDAKRIQSYGRR